jgi:hypothetical protein
MRNHSIMLAYIAAQFEQVAIVAALMASLSSIDSEWASVLEVVPSGSAVPGMAFGMANKFRPHGGSTAVVGPSAEIQVR